MARALSLARGCTVSVSGPVDLITDGNAVVRVENGAPLMARVTGVGCTATAITAAFVAVNPVAPRAAAHAMAVMGLAGEVAAAGCPGPGSLVPRFLDALHHLAPSRDASRLRVSGLEPVAGDGRGG